MNRRSQIIEAIVDLLKEINGDSPYLSTLNENVKNKLIFWDEVNEYPLVCLNAGTETREYLPGDFKWGFLNVTIRIYVKGDDAKEKLENIFSDIEAILDANNNLAFGPGPDEECVDIRILSISDDEGLLAPLGVGEMLLEIRYSIN